MAKKTFTLRPVDGGEPVSFELAYKVTDPDGAVHEEIREYECFADLPADANRYLAIGDSAMASIGFLQRCIKTEAAEADFLELIVDKAAMVRREDLADVMEWLVEFYTVRPTERPAS